MTPTAAQNESSLQYLKGIGPKRAEALQRIGIATRRDLLDFFPRKYLDRTNVVTMDRIAADQEVTVVGRIENMGMRPTRRRIFYLIISDGRGMLQAVWFNQTDHYRRIFKTGEWIALSGKISFYRGYQMVHPDFDLLGDPDLSNAIHTGKILPVYPGAEELRRVGLNSYAFRKIFFSNIQDLLPLVPEIFPGWLLRKREHPSRRDAYRRVHLPDNPDPLEQAVRRLKYEEFFFPQLMLSLQHNQTRNRQPGIAFAHSSPRLVRLFEGLPFEMTPAQKRVVKEIRADMKRPHPMNRLLQGDVGSGKTLVAVMAMLIAVDNQYQAALMVPTEILAEQHYLNFTRMLHRLDVPVHLLTASAAQPERAALQKDLSAGTPLIIVGTHALIQESVDFSRLGLVIIDEQHRFGVTQRASLQNKGINADVLVMTATPIPRTLALTVYGNLDVSVLDQMPPGRRPIQTAWRTEVHSEQIHQFIRERIAAGEQAFIVFPLIEESEKIDVKAAVDSHGILSRKVFPDASVGLLHGRLRTHEKNEVMNDFVSGKSQILVSTTVIEVGVDIPNATVMVIEHAERFGLSQLHQLRGRVGRGEKPSWCILKTPAKIGETAAERMKTMVELQDGFKLSEKDLELRGWGEFFGTRQHGMPAFRLANPITDQGILQQARQDARRLIREDPHLRSPSNAPLREYFREHYSEQFELYRVG